MTTADHPTTLPTKRANPFDPPLELAGLRAHSPICRLRYPDGHLGWLITGYDLARKVLADPRFSARSELKRVPVARRSLDPFYGAEALPGWLVDMDPPQHTRIRRRLARAFTVHRMRSLRPRIEEVVAEHVTAMAAAGDPCDFVESFALPIPSLVISELLGVPYSQRGDFQRNSATMFSLTATAEQAARAVADLEAILAELAAHKARQPGEDLLSVLAVDGELSIPEIAGVGTLLLSAGHETTAGSLSLGVFALLSHPDQRSRLVADPTLADTAVEELLRYLTIFHFGVPRSPLEDVTLAGETVRAGESVTVSLPAANRDPERFPDPDRLDVGRNSAGHLAFGHGMHQCIGQNLARLEMRVAFPALFHRFPRLRLAVPSEQILLGEDTGFYCAHRLPVAWS
ncbi:cytochrome P450 [Streptomyces sp. NPDC021093]|uniref:cytochrome P450 n=1 Tax=Streptomyces sp. NPDC021093 TaxID=3365112 RepID=UPI00378CA4CA